MKVQFDTQADALYIRLDDSAIVESEEVSPGIILDFAADDRVVGFEILGASKRVKADRLRQMQFEVVEPAA
jgi:uncharacterized protein YuzE